MANVIKGYTAYEDTLDISYGRYVIKIRFNFKKLCFEAYTASSADIFEYDIEKLKKHLDITCKCLKAADIKFIACDLNIHENIYGHLCAEEKPKCFINTGVMFDFMTNLKLRGDI